MRLLVVILSGGRVDYLPGANRPWYVRIRNRAPGRSASLWKALCANLFLAAIALPLLGQLPQTAIFAFAGYGTKIDGTVGYAQLISQASQTYSFTGEREIPVHGNTALPNRVVMTGLLTHLRDMGWLHIYGLAQAGGGSTAAGATVGAFALGGVAEFHPPNWKHFGFGFGADQQKTAGGKAYSNFDCGVVYRP